ncbi:hypothetical protein Gorai_008093 [Gossypium raimondii]|uniref:CCHC-type domain-containing protein n=1 Tax=Gossypium raimondii TaxID=29730 RepID=A0A7J8QAN4_GOSRA|nr:hypothetical protein [Gossypium raimondii]
MLMGGARQGENEKANKEDNIALDERDVIFGEVDGIPSIRVSNRIRLPRLLSAMYKRSIMKVVDKCIRVIKIYYNTNVKSQGKFVRMAVLVELRCPLISKIWMRAIFKGLYEDMLNVCFSCGHYRHFKDGCPKVQRYGEEEKVANSKPSPTTMRKKVEEEACGD